MDHMETRGPLQREQKYGYESPVKDEPFVLQGRGSETHGAQLGETTQGRYSLQKHHA